MVENSDAESKDEQRYEDIFLARQPVFKRDMSVWAYELLYRDRKLAQNAVFIDEMDATLKVLAGLPLCIDFTDEPTNIIINFSAKAIKEKMHTAYPSGKVIIQLTDEVTPDHELLSAIATLRQEGYRYAVDNYENDPSRDSLYRLADYLTIDFLHKKEEQIEELTHLCTSRFPRAQLIAKRIEEYDVYLLAKDLGYNKFQGFFFKAPQVHRGKKISATVSSKLKLLKLLQKQEVEFREIATALSADLAIIHRLLAYINSPSLGLRSKVNSIEDALVIMGLNPLKKWLQIIILTDMTPKNQPDELVLLSAQRACFLENLAVRHNFQEIKAPLFLMGLFSLIDVILSHPKKILISKLSLDPELENALLGNPSKYTLWLNLVESCEKADWAEVERMAGQLGIPPKGLYVDYEAAFQTAASFF
ncbi:MAG: HDOD domain-containing protein [Desulfobacter sp.]|nr:MAG: HDOD domain-containing protein [Desulfobacter sp.]